MLTGLITGLVNGFFASGGGLVAIPALKMSGLSKKESHTNAIALTMPLSIVSAIFYFINGNMDFIYALYFLPSGLLGAFVGIKLFRRISPKMLERIFGFLLIISAVRIFLR